MKTISVLNYKGGVGKTTFAGCTAQALAIVGFRVLAIDNDSQHNLSSLFGVGIQSPGIRDVYRAPAGQAPHILIKSIRTTELPNLHVVTSSSDLCNADVVAVDSLKNALFVCNLGRFYDFIIIDNAPGLDRLQAASRAASDEIFVPTQLGQFAVNGLVEMEQILKDREPAGCRITRIIPNFYRNTKRHNAFLAALNKLFPGRVTPTAIPADGVFDELATSGKVLFLHRLYSPGAAYYLKLIHDLFDLDEDDVWEMVKTQRQERMSEEARERYFIQQKARATQ